MISLASRISSRHPGNPAARMEKIPGWASWWVRPPTSPNPGKGILAVHDNPDFSVSLLGAQPGKVFQPGNPDLAANPAAKDHCPTNRDRSR